MGQRLWKVELGEQDRQRLEAIAFRGSDKAYRIKTARALLKASEGMTDQRIHEALAMGKSTVFNLRRRFCQEGLDSCLNRKEQERRFRKIDGEIEARIAQIACSKAPEGRSSWTLDLLTDRIAQLNIVPGGVSRATVGRVLKKIESNRGRPSASASRKPTKASL